MTENILIVDDNADILSFLRAALESEGYFVIEAASGEEALRLVAKSMPDCIILDVGIGKPDGLEVCKRIRSNSQVPIIMLTARDEEIDEVMCLSAGADDYITKPVSPRILALRIANQLNRKKMSEPKQATILKAGGLTLDLIARELRVGETLVPLTRTEFEFLELLMQSPNRVYTREQLIEAIGASPDYSSDHLLDTHASRMRIKIKSAGGPRVIAAIRTVGYRLLPTES